MGATVNIASVHGATPTTVTNVDGSSIRFKQAGNDTVDAVNPIPIPAAGTEYSWIKQLQFAATTTPSNTINNLRFSTDGANTFGTGVSLNVRTFASITGTASSGSTTTLTHSGFTNGALVGYVLEITGGTNSGEARRITANTTTVITVASAFTSAIDATSVYRVAYFDPINNAATVLSGTTDAFTYTSGSPLSVTGSINNPSTGRFGSYITLQMAVASTASPGTTPSETLSYTFDES